MNKSSYLHTLAEEGIFETVFDHLQEQQQNESFDIDALDDYGYCALHYAANEGFEDVVDLLLQAGASPWTMTCDGSNDR